MGLLFASVQMLFSSLRSFPDTLGSQWSLATNTCKVLDKLLCVASVS